MVEGLLKLMLLVVVIMVRLTDGVRVSLFPKKRDTGVTDLEFAAFEAKFIVGALRIP